MKSREKEIVFYKGWFEKHQRRLLWFANTRIGRYVLRLHGDRSGVGRSKIFKIEPHAIHWRSEGKMVAEFRTHAKFAKRLYYTFRPIWYLMHFWDWLVADRFIPRLSFQFTTLTKYPDANPESNTVDGFVYHNEIPATNWGTVRSGAGTIADSTATNTMMVGFYVEDCAANDWYWIRRSIFLFNTSSLTSSAVIFSGIMSIYGSGKSDFIGCTMDISIYSSAPASNTNLVAGDFNSLGGTPYSNVISEGSWNTSGYNAFTLNSTGENAISKTGVTKFGARNYTHDDLDSRPTGSAIDKQAGLAGYYADQTGTTKDPKLVIVYGIPATVAGDTGFELEVENPTVAITNPLSHYLQCLLYVNGTLIRSEDIGQETSSHEFVLSEAEINACYAEVPNSTSCVTFIRVKTYLEAGHTTQVGGNADRTGTMVFYEAGHEPIFTTVSFSNVDKNIVVQDKYGNTLITSSTETLMDSSSKMIQGYSKVRATILQEDQAEAQYSATMDKYRFAIVLQYTEADWVDDDVTIDIDNVTLNSFTVTAYDSRGFTTVLNGSLDNIAEYFNISLFGMTLVRDNMVEGGVTLGFYGTFFNEYFGGGTDGVQNEVVCEYRYKETTEEWDEQVWEEITPDISGNDISYSDKIDGDLGVDGFDPEKSYDVEVRIYDKLSQVIIESTVNKGTPVIDLHRDGVAIKAKYDEAVGGSLQVDGERFTPAELDILDGSNTTEKVLNIQAKARVYKSADQNNLTSGVWTQLTLPTEDYDTGSDFASNAFTTPIAGYYLVSGAVVFNDIVANKVYGGAIYYDGSAIVWCQLCVGDDASQWLNVPLSGVIYCVAGKAITLWAISLAGVNTVDISGGNLAWTHLSVTLLSV